MATKKIEFIVSPTGAFQLGYNVGETGTFEVKQADELIDLGYAKEVVKKGKGNTDADETQTETDGSGAGTSEEVNAETK